VEAVAAPGGGVEESSTLCLHWYSCGVKLICNWPSHAAQAQQRIISISLLFRMNRTDWPWRATRMPRRTNLRTNQAHALTYWVALWRACLAHGSNGVPVGGLVSPAPRPWKQWCAGWRACLARASYYNCLDGPGRFCMSTRFACKDAAQAAPRPQPRGTSRCRTHRTHSTRRTRS
jgi:hypothetical protein